MVGPAPVGSGAFAASAVTVSDDLRALDATDLEILVPRSGDRPEGRVHAGVASIRGLAPLGQASNLASPVRALLLAASAAALAALAGGLTLVAAIRSRPAAFALGVVGPAAALLVFSSLERAVTPPAAYLAVPAAGLVALLAAAALLLAARAAEAQASTARARAGDPRARAGDARVSARCPPRTRVVRL